VWRIVWHHYCSRGRCRRGRWCASGEGRSELLPHVVYCLVGCLVRHRRHNRMHHRHCQSKIHGRGGLLPHRRGGGTLLMWGRWDASRSQRKDCFVEAHCQASHRVCPCCVRVVRRPRILAWRAGVGVVDVPAMRAAVVLILKPFEGGGWQERALASAESGLGVRWGLISTAGGRLTP
jgi:hypothetical protein